MFSKSLKKTLNTYELTICAKWLRYNIFNDSKTGEDLDTAIYNTLANKCEEMWEGFDRELEHKKLMTAVEKSALAKLRTSYSVNVSVDEWNVIQGLESENAKKILFVMLVVAKFNRVNPVIRTDKEPHIYDDERLRCNVDMREILKLAKIKYKKEEDFFLFLREYRGIMEFREGKTLKRIFNFGTAEVDGDIQVCINDYGSIVEYYNMQFNNRIKSCGVCKKVFRDSGKFNSQRLCANCKQEARKKEKQVTICTECGKPITVKQGDNTKKICKECKNKRPQIQKKCCDCGNVFFIKETRGQKQESRCSDCYRVYRLEYQKRQMSNIRKKL